MPRKRRLSDGEMPASSGGRLVRLEDDNDAQQSSERDHQGTIAKIS